MKREQSGPPFEFLDPFDGLLPKYPNSDPFDGSLLSCLTSDPLHGSFQNCLTNRVRESVSKLGNVLACIFSI